MKYVDFVIPNQQYNTHSSGIRYAPTIAVVLPN